MPQEDRAHTAHIEVAADALTAELVAPAGIAPPDRAAVVAMMNELKLELTPATHELIDEAVGALAALGGGAARIVVARGVAPQHAQPGRVAFEPGYDPDEIKQALEKAVSSAVANRPAGSVDHYTRASFTPIRVGTHVATIMYPSQGQSGRDVFGNVLPPIAAENNDFSIDDTLRKGEGGCLIAMRPGVLEWGPGGLHITDTITIPGSIDFSVGHVDFPGSVNVQGGVRDCFKVIVKDDLAIEGLIEAATIRAGRDASIRGGMAAKEKGSLDAGRDLFAKYLNNVTINVGRDMTVERELVNCRATVGRNLMGPKCGIAGGAIAVAGTVEVATVGSEMGVATDLRLGSIPALESVLKEALALMPVLEARRAKYLEPLEQLRAVKGRQSPTMLEKTKDLERQVEVVNTKIDPLQQRIDMLRSTLRSKTVIDLIVHGRIYPKVLLTAGNFTIDFVEQLKGPFRITMGDGYAPQLCLLDGKPNGELINYAKVRRIDLAAGANSASRAA